MFSNKHDNLKNSLNQLLTLHLSKKQLIESGLVEIVKKISKNNEKLYEQDVVNLS